MSNIFSLTLESKLNQLEYFLFLNKNIVGRFRQIEYSIFITIRTKEDGISFEMSIKVLKHCTDLLLTGHSFCIYELLLLSFKANETSLIVLKKYLRNGHFRSIDYMFSIVELKRISTDIAWAS
jgi:hypothetical protein